MKNVRIGVIGLGNMGSGHIRNIEDGKISGLDLVAVCDSDTGKLKKYEGKYKTFARSEDLIRSGEVDAVMIETPHYSHTTIGIDALDNGLHVLVEKPVSVHVADCQRLFAAHKRHRKLVFGAMFNQRPDPHFAKVREIVKSGMLGEITRVNWIITDWFRPEFYYKTGGWRATWKGEGGGVLMNQCPHNLDLLQWMFGMPRTVRAFCQFGKWHDIEVEDAVTAYLTYPNGATGVFVTTTGEAPGTNRLEVCGEMGKIVVENGQIKWTRNTVGQAKFSATTTSSFGKPETWNVEIPVSGNGGQHVTVLQNFVDAIRSGATLIAPAEEGINSVMLSNAMIYSSLKDKTVKLPLDGAEYEKLLKKLVKGSKAKKETVSVELSAAEFAASASK